MLIAIILILSMKSAAFAQNNQQLEQSADSAQTVITADIIECFTKDNVCHAVGNAKAVRTKEGQVSTLTAKKLTAYFAEGESKEEAKAKREKEPHTQGVERIEANDNVKLVFDNKVIKADRGIYHRDKQQIQMYGHVVATETTAKQGRHLQGEYAIIEIASGHYQVFPHAPGAKPSTKSGKQVKILILEKDTK